MNNNYIKDDTIEKYPKIKGKYKAMFGIPHTLLPKLHKEIYDLYSTSHLLKLIDPKSVHKIITNFFINEYYPVMSKKFNTNDKTAVIIMGTVGFNMNIPKNLGKLVFTKTEDIDLKIYTTELCYNKSKNNTNVVKSIISLFKYMVIMICMFIKQIIAEILDFSKNIFINTKSNIKKKYSKNKSYSFKNNSISNFKSTVKKNKKSNKIDLEGNKIKLINNNKKNFGLLHNASMYIIIKKGVGKDYIDEKINITNLSYEETYNILQEKINDIDLLITSKIKYT